MAIAFMSYASKDDHFADLATRILEDAGIQVWIDDGALRAGEEWRNAIDQGISSADVVLVLLTPQSCESPYVTYEWAFALGKGIKVIPLLFEECEIHPRLVVLQYFDFRNQRTGPWQKLVKQIIEPSAASKAEVKARDKDRVKIEGEYRTNDSRQYRIKIIHLSDNYYRVENPEWEGVGLFDGDMYYGIYKVSDDDAEDSVRGNWGAHRARFLKADNKFELFGIELNETELLCEFNPNVAWIKTTKKN